MRETFEKILLLLVIGSFEDDELTTTPLSENLNGNTASTIQQTLQTTGEATVNSASTGAINQITPSTAQNYSGLFTWTNLAIGAGIIGGIGLILYGGYVYFGPVPLTPPTVISPISPSPSQPQIPEDPGEINLRRYLRALQAIYKIILKLLKTRRGYSKFLDVGTDSSETLD
jgi:hypothetical protein